MHKRPDKGMRGAEVKLKVKMNYLESAHVTVAMYDVRWMDGQRERR